MKLFCLKLYVSTSFILPILLICPSAFSVVTYRFRTAQQFDPPVRGRPTPPDTPTPSGDPVPGGTRPENQCPPTEKPLTAIAQSQGRDFTLSEYPTFFFYIPYTPEQVESIEFLLLNQTERETIYQSGIRLTEGPGIIKLKIPPEFQYALAVNQNYRWRLNLSCKPNQTLESDQVVRGWIRRVPKNAQIINELAIHPEKPYIAYQNQEIWHSAITHLAEGLIANPGNSESVTAWSELLQTLNYDWVIPEPFVESELVEPRVDSSRQKAHNQLPTKI